MSWDKIPELNIVKIYLIIIGPDRIKSCTAIIWDEQRLVEIGWVEYLWDIWGYISTGHTCPLDIGVHST